MATSKYGSDAEISGTLLVTGSTIFNEDSHPTYDFRVESDARPYALWVDSGADRIGLGCFVEPLHNVEIQHEGADGDEGLMIIRYDGAVYTDNILGGIGFDSADGNRPSRTNESSAYIAGYASQNHSTTEKGGYLVLGTAPDDQNDDTASSERVRITSAGDVGIGVTAPAETLDVAGSARTIKNSDSAGAKAKFILAKSKGTAGSEAVVSSGDTIGAVEFNAYDGDTFETAAEIYAKVDNTPGDGDMPGALYFATTADGADSTTDRMTITSAGSIILGGGTLSSSAGATFLGTIIGSGDIQISGNIGIGMEPAKPLDITTSTNGFPVQLINDGDSTGKKGMKIQCGVDDPSSATNVYLLCNDGDGTASGQLQDANGTFSAADTSDRRLKQNIVDTELDGLSTINKIKVRDFEWKRSGKKATGFIAQEVRESFPMAASGDESGDLKEEPMMIMRDVMVIPLIKAVQELSAKVKELEERLDK